MYKLIKRLNVIKIPQSNMGTNRSFDFRLKERMDFSLFLPLQLLQLRSSHKDWVCLSENEKQKHGKIYRYDTKILIILRAFQKSLINIGNGPIEQISLKLIKDIDGR